MADRATLFSVLAHEPTSLVPKRRESTPTRYCYLVDGNGVLWYLVTPFQGSPSRDRDTWQSVEEQRAVSRSRPRLAATSSCRRSLYSLANCATRQHERRRTSVSFVVTSIFPFDSNRSVHSSEAFYFPSAAAFPAARGTRIKRP